MHEEPSNPILMRIDDLTIRQDSEGRFCLNDLHKAAGGKSRHQPSKWLARTRSAPDTWPTSWDSIRWRMVATTLGIGCWSHSAGSKPSGRSCKRRNVVENKPF